VGFSSRKIHLAHTHHGHVDSDFALSQVKQITMLDQRNAGGAVASEICRGRLAGQAQALNHADPEQPMTGVPDH
jgi:hypothetical protein